MFEDLKKKLSEHFQHEYRDITQHEIEALKFEYNLADAHTHQSQSPTQRKIVESLPELWFEAEKTKQHDMEQKFIQTFLRSQRQYAALETPTMLVYAASIAMVMVANYLMQKKMKVGLLEPCFDNIPDIFKHEKVPLEPVSESLFHDPEKIYGNLKKNVKADALFIVDPNNPTGFTLTGSAKNADDTKRGFLELFRYAKDHNKLLIFDFCFASFLLPGTELVRDMSTGVSSFDQLLVDFENRGESNIDIPVYIIGIGLTDSEKTEAQKLQSLFKSDKKKALTSIRLRKYRGSPPGPK